MRREAEKRPVAALAYVGDAMEENPDELCQLAGEIGLLGVRAFMFHEGKRPGRRAHVPRDRQAHRRRLPALRQLRRRRELRTLLQAVATYAAGGLKALEASKGAGARLLLPQLKR